MKFRIHGMFLSLFFALGLCFSFSIETSAHTYTDSVGNVYDHPDVEGVTAEDVENAAAGDKEEYTKKFLLHAATHLKLIWENPDLSDDNAQEKSREIVIFASEARKAGVFNHGDTYIIGSTYRGSITNHGRYQHLFGSRYFKDGETPPEPVKTLLEAGNLSDNAPPTCKDYEYDGQSRVACAIKQETPIGVVTTIAGFHHAETDLIRPDCDDFTLETTAEQVEKATDPATKKDLLQKYVKGVSERTKKLINDTGMDIFTDFPGIAFTSPQYNQEFSTRINEKALCFRKEPDFLYGSIYAFIMDPVRGVVFLTANNFTRNGQGVSLTTDPNPVEQEEGYTEPNILTLIHRTLTDTPTGPITQDDINSIEDGDFGFFTYHWADPTNPDLNTPDFLSRCVVPGRALKQSYIEAVDVSGTGFIFVFGSGIYLEEDMIPDESTENFCLATDGGDDGDDGDGGDDGCAVAAADNTPQSALFNLFLVVSVLFSAVFLRKRI